MRARREVASVFVGVDHQGKAQFAEVVQAGGPAGGFLGPSESREEHSSEDGDDRNDNQQLD